MGDHTTDRQKRIVQELTFDSRTAKRVRWTEWEFTIQAPQQIRVTNASYGIEKDSHIYTVAVANCESHDGLYVPLACDCPAYHFGGDETACKHMVAVAVCGGPVLLGAAMAYTGAEADDSEPGNVESDAADRRERAVATDGGQDHPEYDDRDVEPERARERETTAAYSRAPADDREARADALGLSHTEGCDGDSDGIECWRCYYLQETGTKGET